MIQPVNMIIQHVTSIECAYKIVSSGEYRPISSDPAHHDAGLNCLNGNPDNRYENIGVTLQFKWAGPTIRTQSDANLPKNTLVDNGPWRLIVPTGTNAHLTFDSLSIKNDNAFDAFVHYHTPWYFKIPFSNWLQKRKNKILSFFSVSKGKKIIVL